MKNGGILGVTKGIEEAAAAIGWDVQGASTAPARSPAAPRRFGQAMALKPDGIIIGGFDAVEQAPAMEAAKAASIPLVSWHAGPVIGPMPEQRRLRQRHHRPDGGVHRRGRCGPMSTPRASPAS